MSTRIVHHVRITNPNDKDMWVEVKVHDTIMYKGPNGQDMVLDFRQRNVVADIDDRSGDGNGVQNSNATRLSTIYRMTNPDDDTYYLDVEVLDGIRFKGPNGKDGVLHMPSSISGINVDDTDGTGATGNGGTTQFAHTLKVVDPLSTTAKEDESDEFIGVTITDAIRFKGTNAQESVLYFPNVDEEDTTAWETDDDGNQKAPENTDANKYVTFADSTTDNPDGGPEGPWLKNGSQGFGISQGILWHITKASGGHTKPWWVWVPTQQPMQISGYLFADRLIVDGSWIGYTNFDLRKQRNKQLSHFEDYAVPDPPHWPSLGDIPLQGFDSLDINARQFVAGTTKGVDNPPIKVNFLLYPDEPHFILFGGQNCGVYQPNIFQIVGRADEQPFKKNPDGSDFIDPDTGKKVPKMPSKKLAKDIVQDFVDQWTESSDLYNEDASTVDTLEFLGNPIQYMPYPTWAFKDPLLVTVPNPSSVAQRFWFIGGIPAGFWFFNGEFDAAFDTFSAYASYIGADQLDEKVWDTSGDEPVLRPPPA
jgi:hypothetical protein